MLKDIVKELVIVILILIVVALLLGILFYEYIPMNKTVPVKVEAYKISNELEQELGKEVIEGNDGVVTKTYSVEDYELQEYENNEEYDKGKKNPFSTIEEGIIIEPPDENIIDDNPNINTTK